MGQLGGTELLVKTAEFRNRLVLKIVGQTDKYMYFQLQMTYSVFIQVLMFCMYSCFKFIVYSSTKVVLIVCVLEILYHKGDSKSVGQLGETELLVKTAELGNRLALKIVGQTDKSAYFQLQMTQYVFTQVFIGKPLAENSIYFYAREQESSVSGFTFHQNFVAELLPQQKKPTKLMKYCIKLINKPHV